jgi:hypothetical protein
VDSLLDERLAALEELAREEDHGRGPVANLTIKRNKAPYTLRKTRHCVLS